MDSEDQLNELAQEDTEFETLQEQDDVDFTEDDFDE